MFDDIIKKMAFNKSFINGDLTLFVDKRGFETINGNKHFVTGDIRNVVYTDTNKICKNCFFFDSMFNAVCFFKINTHFLNDNSIILICGKIFEEKFATLLKEFTNKSIRYIFCFPNETLGRILTIKYILFLNGFSSSVIIDEEDRIRFSYGDHRLSFKNQEIKPYMITRRLSFENFYFDILTPSRDINDFKNNFGYL